MKTVTGDPHEFVDAFERRYLSLSSLDDVCRRVEYDAGDSGHVDRDYHQVGVRTNFPVRVVERWEPGFVAREVVDGLQKTELEFVVDGLRGSEDVEQVPVDDVDEALDVVDSGDVDHLLVPGHHDMVDRLEEAGLRTGSVDGADVVESRGDVDVFVHRHPGDGVYAVEEDAVEVVQKHGEDAEPPGFPYFDEADFNYRRRLMVYFGTELRGDDESYVDLMYRVVLSTPEVDGGALRIRL